MKLQDFDFRIWDDETKEYIINPTLVRAIDSGEIFCGSAMANSKKGLDVKMKHNEDHLELELWTGYLDKNGKKIYEGDILENKMTMEDLPYKVVFKWGAFYLVEIDGNDEDLMSEFLFMELEVIGNIHENPELLKC